MSQVFPISAAQNKAAGIMFGTSSSDNSKGESVDVVNGAAKAYVTTLLSGEDQVLGTQGMINNATEYVEAPGVTTAVDITLSTSVGDYLRSIVVYNGSAAAISLIVIKDGTTALGWVVPASLAAGATLVIGEDLLGVRAKNGGWKIALTCAGTMSLIKVCAKGLFQG